MWLSLFIAAITYLLQPRDTSKERKKALLTAAAAGGLTYAATEYTDWGSELSNKFDSAVGLDKKPVTTAATAATAATEATTGTAATGTAGPSGNLWSTLSSWGAAGTAAVVGTTGAVATGNTKWLWIAAAGAAALLLIK